jgi:hypothetical protein
MSVVEHWVARVRMPASARTVLGGVLDSPPHIPAIIFSLQHRRTCKRAEGQSP